MEVKRLIEQLKKLPQNATIGSFDEQDMSINDNVTIYRKDSEVYGISETKMVKRIEEARYSNNSKICDYYIGY